MSSDSPALFPEPIFKVKTPAKVDPTGYKVVSVRLREGEFATLNEQAAAFGLTNNMALRIAARRISGFLEIDGETRQSLQSISDSIGDISDSIRDLSEQARRSQGFDVTEFATQRAAFGAEFIQLDRQLRTLLNVSRRRSDGAKLLSQPDL